MIQGTYTISPAHYNDIPDHILQGEKTILEFGPATGINHLISRHRQFFIDNDKAGRYLGVDVVPYKERYFNIEQGDIRHFQTDEQFDIVLALHVLEHVELRHWRRVFRNLMAWVAPDGFLILGTPHDEPPDTWDQHVTSRITPDMVRQYLPDAQVQRIRTRYRFADDNARFIWALLRYIKRWLTGHPYVRTYARLLAIWRNE